ncbi:hypothetical protein RhiirA1_429005 [Rhizophagus irregularis]|uniref:Uncharacterized protein n=1 Tax=Rhizophagus irregularis TaxID=588596 RepID=A0A2N0R003_9GLOM|nr:hypothetical protein RhiirA1_429005 [Rhizophagus irregularis]
MGRVWLSLFFTFLFIVGVGQNWKLHAWRKMMKSVGCTNITPYKKQKLKPEFWTYVVNSSSEFYYNGKVWI